MFYLCAAKFVTMFYLHNLVKTLAAELHHDLTSCCLAGLSDAYSATLLSGAWFPFLWFQYHEGGNETSLCRSANRAANISSGYISQKSTTFLKQKEQQKKIYFNYRTLQNRFTHF